MRETVIRSFIAGVFFTLGIGTTALLAVVPNIFSPGESLDSTKMNANFAAIDPQFSTTEIATHKRWIDGKVIYRKVIDVGALPNNTTNTVAHGITGVDKILEIYGSATNGIATRPLPYPSNVASDTILINTDTTVISITTGFNWSAYTGKVVLDYAKN